MKNNKNLVKQHQKFLQIILQNLVSLQVISPHLFIGKICGYIC